MATQNENRGGYGDDTGRQRPMDGAPRESDTAPAPGTGANGRENPVTSPVDADEALGNRTGGYGGNPPSTTSDQPDGASGED